MWYLFYVLVVCDTVYSSSENNHCFLTLEDKTKSNGNKMNEICVDDKIKQNDIFISMLSGGTALLEKEKTYNTGKLGIK